MNITKEHIAKHILNRLETEKEHLKSHFSASQASIGYFFIDDLLPEDLVKEIYTVFPKIETTVTKKNIREHKHVAYQMNKYHHLLEKVIYAFQEKKVVAAISEICGIENLLPDENLYAGGLSLMQKDNFLHPHLDNSHDKDRNNWRVLNLLYYVTPEWKKEYGGNLELWQNGTKNQPTTITSKYNRLVVMATHQNSWHSVSKVKVDIVRCCISNYYFSNVPLKESDSFHVTSFRGRPEHTFSDFLLRTETNIRMLLRKLFKKGVRENPHRYKK